MKVILLAAGESKRLYPLTKEIQKCLIRFGHTSLLEYTIEKCVNNGLNDFIIVTGHGAKLVERELKKIQKRVKMKYETIYNDNYNKKNNCYSLLIGIENINGDIMLFNSDVLFDAEILKGIKNSRHSALVIDNVKKITKESMKVYVKNGKITQISKALPIRKSYGEYIGIAKIVKNDMNLLKKFLKKLVKRKPNSFYEGAFKLMPRIFRVVDTNGLRWGEIDTFEDLRKVKKMVKCAK